MSTEATYTLKPGQELVVRGPATIHTDASIVVKVANSGETATITVDTQEKITRRRLPLDDN